MVMIEANRLWLSFLFNYQIIKMHREFFEQRIRCLYFNKLHSIIAIEVEMYDPFCSIQFWTLIWSHSILFVGRHFVLYTVYLFVTNELLSITMLIIMNVFNWVSLFFEFHFNSVVYCECGCGCVRLMVIYCEKCVDLIWGSKIYFI